MQEFNQQLSTLREQARSYPSETRLVGAARVLREQARSYPSEARLVDAARALREQARSYPSGVDHVLSS